MSSSYRLTDQVIARRLAERTASPNPGLVADILRATETHPQRRGRLFRAWSTASVLLMLALLLVALAAIGIATAPRPMPPGLSVSVGHPMGGLQLSPDGRWGLPMAPGGHHAVVSTDPGAPRAADGSYEAVVTLKGDASGGAAWSPDSRYVAWYGTSYPGVVTIYDLDHPHAAPTTISVAAALSGTARFIGMLWSPDGSQILFGTANCEYPCSAPSSATQLYLLDVRTGSMKVVSRTLPPGPVSTWAPDGQSIGFVGGLIIDLHGQAIRDLLPLVSDSAPSTRKECGSGPHWSPDGRRIAIIDSLTPDSGRLLIFDPGASGARVLAADACAIIGWSPAGDRIVFRTGDPFATESVQQGQGGGLPPTGPGSDAWIVSVDGGEPQLIKHLGWGEVPILAWSSPGG
jgi:Tol biopolymer transport system component